MLLDLTMVAFFEGVLNLTTSSEKIAMVVTVAAIVTVSSDILTPGIFQDL